MALREAIYLCGGVALGARNDWNGRTMGMERSLLRGTEIRSATRKGAEVAIMATIRRRSSPSLGTLIMPFVSLQSQLQRLSLQSSNKRPNRNRHSCRAKSRDEDDADDEKVYDEHGRDRDGFDRSGRDRFGRDKYGLDEEGFDRFGLPGDAVLDGQIIEPEYTTYIDPSTGEPAPTYGVRTPLPNAAFWGEDLTKRPQYTPPSAQRGRSARSSRVDDDEQRDVDAAAAAAAFSDNETPPKKRKRPGRKRKKSENSSAEPQEEQSDELSEEELANIAQLQSLRDKFRAEEEGDEYKSIAQSIKDSKVDEKAEGEDRGVPKKGAGEEEEDVSLGKMYGQNGFGARSGYALVGDDVAAFGDGEDKPLGNDELWWNWQKPSADEKPWSAWQKRAGDSDTVMAAAMAETGQIKLFGEKPTIAEATLARARKHVFYNERMAAEEERKNDIGALAYYKEWVKAYKKDTSKEAVQKHHEKTGEEVGIQLLDMFAHQTDKEYRIMMGTDIRIRRDPLIMRMRPDQIKQVWGGDPVYPTINYVQDPDSVVDYRNENMHEPIPDIIELIRESGRLITQEELKAMLEEDKIEDDELGVPDEFSGAVDIGEEDEDDDEDEDEVDFEEQTHAQAQANLANSMNAAKRSAPAKEVPFELEEIEVDGDADEVKDLPLSLDADDET